MTKKQGSSWKKVSVGVVLAVGLLTLTACGSSTTQTSSGNSSQPAKKKTFLIGMSQCNLAEPWRVAMDNQIQAAAAKHPEFKVVFSDAGQDNSKQIADVENFIQQKVDLLIISPNEAKPLTAVVKKAYDAGIPVIVLDRKVEGDAYTEFIGADNKMIGEKEGEQVIKLLGDKGGNVVEIKGLEGSTPAQDRHDGFMEAVKDHSNIKIVAAQNADWLKDKAVTVMSSILQANPHIDLVYGQNDPMAQGAYLAAKNVNRQNEMKFVGIDGLPTPDGGIKSVMDGTEATTFVYPTGGAEAIDSAYKILEQGQTVDKNITLGTVEVTKDNAEDVYKQFGGK